MSGNIVKLVVKGAKHGHASVILLVMVQQIKYLKINMLIFIET